MKFLGARRKLPRRAGPFLPKEALGTTCSHILLFTECVDQRAPLDLSVGKSFPSMMQMDAFLFQVTLLRSLSFAECGAAKNDLQGTTRFAPFFEPLVLGRHRVGCFTRWTSIGGSFCC